ncbi:hypothetical protein OUZ56_002832 [Daphnia magna]|uniref:Uncharacterized protein n=1 Tax=Daphnia magna TaxID=35525 RepID=A0ABR0A7E1_9CRUS|nr:hypothetical protein OUZ56_002832 [Daphnia magna]
MYSYVKSSAKVIGLVAVGAGVVAIGWLGWKAYAKDDEEVVDVPKAWRFRSEAQGPLENKDPAEGSEDAEK